MPKHPEHKGGFKEQQPLPYYLASTFKTRADAEQPYQRVQELVFSPTYDLELSAFHFERKPHDPSMPPLERPWFVVVLGEQSPEPIQTQLLELLGSGHMTTLALETVVTLAQRRSQAIKRSKQSEGHYAAGITMPEVSINVQGAVPAPCLLQQAAPLLYRRG